MFELFQSGGMFMYVILTVSIVAFALLLVTARAPQRMGARMDLPAMHHIIWPGARG